MDGRDRKQEERDLVVILYQSLHYFYKMNNKHFKIYYFNALITENILIKHLKCFINKVFKM